MDLSCLIPLITEMPAYRRLTQELAKLRGEHKAVVLQAAKPYLVAALYQQIHWPLLVVTPHPGEAKKLYGDLLVWCGKSPVLLFPEPDVMPYERLTPDPSISQQRLKVLSSLNNIKQKLEIEVEAPLVVASASAIAQKTTAYADFVSLSHLLIVGMHVSPLELVAKWQDMGYQVENLVEVPGVVSRRGNIADIYPPNSELPIRIEFCGNEIESIRFFDPQSQRSLKSIPQVAIVPAQEIALCDTIIDYLPQDAWLILDEPADIEQALEGLAIQANELRQAQIDKGELALDSFIPYLSWPELVARLKQIERCLKLIKWEDEAQGAHILSFAPAPIYGGQQQDFLKQVQQMLHQGNRLVVASQQAARLGELLGERGILVSSLSQLTHLPPPGSLSLICGSVSQGWMMGASLALFTDAEIFGFVKQQRLVKSHRHPPYRAGIPPGLSLGEYVVHVEHGIACFKGMTKKSIDGVEREYLILEYAAGDRLYVPSDQANRVGRYLGSGGAPPTLSRLGGAEWQRIKQKVKERAKATAQELLTLYSSREIIPGFPFSPDVLWQQELEASFPYVETPDQLEAVQQVKQDMERAKPMDRLVCGDVGYGKTEIALRAAFKVVMDGRQVAMLVPTTVLAQQHFITFSQRLSAFPIKVEMLSRFRSEKEQQTILGELANGTVDICIGTHRLLQNDVAFKYLGLVIIDEEQRFGVAHKEHLKQMRNEVDVLTLSATPIPRTLQMSLLGVRDISTMETPPEERLPIKTYVAEYNDRLIREAIIRELERNGQVFLVHNRIHSIHQLACKLRQLAPEAEIAIAHGQMPEEELERVMFDFTQGRVDVLLCTTIIESGLDIANVNTLIVDEADKLGLAQLYQLRGRVGRGSNRAYAYFLYKKGKRLSAAAEKRLQTIFEASELGAGFRIAIKDLEIRGAGNLLGAEQSGHIAAVGFDLYCQLLAEGVEELKAKQAGEAKLEASFDYPAMPSIDLPLSAHIPDDYVADLDTRLTLYKQLARVESAEEVKKLAEEFRDRFGKLPSAVNNLLYIVSVKLLAAQAGVESIFRENKQIVIKFKQKGKITSTQPEYILRKDGIKAGSSELRLDIKRLAGKWPAVLEQVVREYTKLSPVQRD